MTEEEDDEDLIEELKKLPGNRPSEDRETGESDVKVRSLLNYPEVQRAFVQLAKCNADVSMLVERNMTLKNQLADSERRANNLQRERDNLKAQAARLSSLLPKEERDH